jgi:dCMP deaminase
LEVKDMSRLSREEYYMNIAVQTSLRSTCIRRKVGAIIVKDDRILSTGYNGAPSGIPNCCDDCKRCYRSAHNIPSGQMLDMCYAVHAEQNAIMNALKTGEDLKGAALYVNTYPCVTCFKLTVQAGIKEVYYIDEYENEFTKQMAKEAGVKLVQLDGSIYRTPVGSSQKTADDMDTIDPLVAQIYKYEPGTEIFAINREKVMKENGLFERYDEMIYYTNYHIDKEIVPITNELYNKIGKQVANRNTLEYNGDAVKQLVIGAVVYDIAKDELIVLKCLGERFAGKFTMIQGHMAVNKNDTARSKLKTIMMRNLRKEITEELNLNFGDILEIEPLYLIQSNDNKVSSEHMGVISLIKIDTRLLDYEIESGEPEKHEVAHLTKYDLSNMELMCRYDTWLKKCIIKMKEDGLI